jgi:hypothetical protein
VGVDQRLNLPPGQLGQEVAHVAELMAEPCERLGLAVPSERAQ